MLNDGLVEFTETEFASPALVVGKKDNPDGTTNKMRLCADLREINQWTVQDPFPFHRIDDLLLRAGGAEWFSKIDFRESFYQIPLSTRSRKYTSFVAPGIHVQHTVLPFGWKNSPQKFQRFMTCHVLRELLHDRRIGNYIDDTFIAAETREECPRITYVVLERFQEAGLIINPVKTQICVPSIKLLGRILDGLTRTTRNECREKSLKSRDPNDIYTLRYFCGLMEQFRDRIDHYSDIIKPLNNLKKKSIFFEWNDECKAAKQLLMDNITQDPVLFTRLEAILRTVDRCISNRHRRLYLST